MGRQDAIDAVTNMISAGYKDRLMMQIMFSKKEYEQELDDMWRIYLSGNPKQIIEYKKGVENIKSAGVRVLRNSAGKHKLELN